MADNAGRIVDASVPLISDAPIGYGSPVNVFRTVSYVEKAGVAGIHIEDQTSKRCGHLAGKMPIQPMRWLPKLTRPAMLVMIRIF